MTDVDEVPRLLFERVPGLRPELADDFAIWEAAAGDSAPNTDYVLASMLVPYIERATRHSSDLSGRAAQILTFLDEMLDDANQSVRDAVAVSFCEQLAANSEAFRAVVRVAPSRLRKALQASLQLD